MRALVCVHIYAYFVIDTLVNAYVYSRIHVQVACVRALTGLAEVMLQMCKHAIVSVPINITTKARLELKENQTQYFLL